MTFGTKVTALTQNLLLPKVTDNVLNGHVLPLRLIGNSKKGAGTSIDKAIKYRVSGQASSFSALDSFTAQELDTKIVLSYDMRGVRIPIALAGTSVVANRVSETQVTDLVKNSVEESEQELLDVTGTMLYGTGTGNSNKDIIGVGGIVDDGTDVDSIGGQSRTTYPILDAYRVAASGSQMTLPKLATMFSGVSSGTGNTSPTLITSNETVWDLYETLLTASVRENYSMMGYYSVGVRGGASRPGEGLKGTQGFVSLTYKGIPWVRDEKATAGNVFMLNENWLQYYGWSADGVFGYKSISLGNTTTDGGVYDEPPLSQFTGFSWSGFRAPTGQFAGIADVIHLGNLTSWQPRRQGRLESIATAA